MDTINFDYKINSVELTRVSNVCDLGIHFDSKLTFNGHIEKIISASYKKLGFIIRNSKDFQNKDALRLLFISIIRSKLEYGAILWNPFYKYQKNNLEIIQKRFVKYCAFKFKINLNYDDLLSEFNLQSLENRRIILQLLTLFKIINGFIDDPQILSILPFNVPNRNTRTTLTFYYSNPATNYQMNSPVISMCRTYNVMGGNLDIFSMSFSLFKERLFETLHFSAVDNN